MWPFKRKLTNDEIKTIANTNKILEILQDKTILTRLSGYTWYYETECGEITVTRYHDSYHCYIKGVELTKVNTVKVAKEMLRLWEIQTDRLNRIRQDENNKKLMAYGFEI